MLTFLIFILCFTTNYSSPRIQCLSDIVQKHSRSSRVVSRSNRQTVPVEFQDEAIFKVFDYRNFTFSDFTFTARYITALQSGSDLVLWVKGKKSPSNSELALSDWHTSQPNLLNSNDVNNSSSLSSLQSDRFKVLTKLAKTLKFEVIPKMEVISSKISDHDSARFSGVHILLYDIKDSFDLDEAFFGGYLDPVDQESAPNGPINLVHMDIYPMTPGGRPSPANVTQKDFYQTITHELFHLYHYRKAKELGTNWGSIHNWLKEGLAQLAVYEFLKDSTFFESSTKILDTTLEYVSQVPSYFQLKTPISIFDNVFENYGLSYVWYPYLLDKKTGDERVKLFTDLMQNTDCTIVNTQLCTNAFSKTLSENGMDLNEELAKFSIAQYFNHEGSSLSSISQTAYTSLDKLRTESSVLTSNMSHLEFGEIGNYKLNYQPIINDSEQYKSIEFSASTSFVLIKYASSSIVKACETSDDFQSCFLALGTDHSFFEGKSTILNLLPNEEMVLIYFFIGHPNADRGKHFVTGRVIDSHNFESKPYFKSRPKIKIVSNSLHIRFEVDSNGFSSIKPILGLMPFKLQGSAIKSAPTKDFNIISTGSNSYNIEAYMEPGGNSLKSLNLSVGLYDDKNDLVGEKFDYSFSSTYPVQIESYSQVFFEGWNSIAIYPDEKNQTISQYLDSNILRFEPNDCIYTYVNFMFHSVRNGISNCSTLASSVSTLVISDGMGIYVKSATKKEISLNRMKILRTKITLTKGWNFNSLSFHHKSKSFNQSGNVAVSYGYNGQTGLWDRVLNFGENSPTISGSDLNSLDAFRAFFIYSLDDHVLYSY